MRLIDEAGSQLGVVKLEQAMELAAEKKLDLVEVAPDSKPSVCKLLDYGKHTYQEKKKRNVAKNRQHQSLVKEIKFRMATGESDYMVKLRRIKEFLNDGDKVKISIWFRGREIVHHRLASKLTDRLKKDLEKVAVVEMEPVLEGKRMNLQFGPLRSQSIAKNLNGTTGVAKSKS